MSKPNGGGSNIIRANITVGIGNNGTQYGYSNTGIDGFEKFGQCSNSKIQMLMSIADNNEQEMNVLITATPIGTSNVIINRLDTGYSISSVNSDESKNIVIITAVPFFVQQDLNNTIPIEITFA